MTIELHHEEHEEHEVKGKIVKAKTKAKLIMGEKIGSYDFNAILN